MENNIKEILKKVDKKTKKDILKIMKKYGDYHWWESNDPIEVAINQIFEPIMISSFVFFKEGLERLLGREVQHIEFGFNMKDLRKEASEAIKRLQSGVLTIQSKEYEREKHNESIRRCMEYRKKLGLKTFLY